MKLFTAALLLVSLVLIAHGGEGLYHAAANRQPVAVTCSQLVQQRPRALWLRVSGCDMEDSSTAETVLKLSKESSSLGDFLQLL